MQEKNTNQTRLPLPKWAMYTLALPTFYMPLAYLIMAIWVIGSMLFGYSPDIPMWMMIYLQPALYVTVCMWVFYFIWVVVCNRLNWKEKAGWSLIVFLLNMVGMPMFYIFITRRYLGYEDQTGNRDEIALNSFMKQHSIEHEQFSIEQLDVLRSYFRTCRLTKWGIVLILPMACLTLYTAVFFIPKNSIRLFSNMEPTRVIIIDSGTDTKKEIIPDAEHQKLYIQNIMMFGALAGILGATGIFYLVQALSLLFGNFHRKAFIDFLKAKKKRHLSNHST